VESPLRASRVLYFCHFSNGCYNKESEMEIAKVEVNAVETTIADAHAQDVQQLQDLELSLVGGGIGIVIVA
jgi:hypothetical protein